MCLDHLVTNSLFHLVDHPILEVVAEGHDAHLVDHMKAARAIEVQDGVERSGKCNNMWQIVEMVTNNQ